MNQYFQAATKLQQYLIANHWRNQTLIGPDPGVRFNYRIGRFIKSYFPSIPWNDDLYYLQGQGYWVLGNWALFTQTGQAQYRDVALQCSTSMLEQQRDDGAWEYPNWEWSGRIATAEGTWGALGLLETYRQTGNTTFLDGILRWHSFLAEKIGFQHNGDTLAINYFAGLGDARIPNNSALVLRFLAELADVTGDERYLHPCRGMLTFMQRVQKATGEFPYAVEAKTDDVMRPHLQCYQYNAFQCLDLIRYYEITQDVATLPLIEAVLNFLRAGQAEDGHAYYECGKQYREVTYHTAVLSAAFLNASQIGVEGYQERAERAYAYVLALQDPDGSFVHSQGDYHLLSDRRSYPRYLAMIMYHLLLRSMAIKNETIKKEAGHVIGP